MCRTRKEWRVGSRHHNDRSASRDCLWTATVQRIHLTTGDTFTEAQHSPPPIRRRHSTHITFPPTDHTQALARREACVQDAKTWLCDNGLVMNDNKSQAIVIRSPSLRTPTSLSRVSISGQLGDTLPVLRDLGFTIDTNLSMTSQVANVGRSAYYHLSRIAKIRHSVSTTVCKSVIHGLVTSRIHYGNAILFGISDRHLHPLEMVQRSAARIVMQIQRGDRQSMTTILRQLHWLPVRNRIEYKLLVLVHKGCLYTMAR